MKIVKNTLFRFVMRTHMVGYFMYLRPLMSFDLIRISLICVTALQDEKKSRNISLQYS